MPSVKYVIELSNQEKVRLMEIVKKGEQSCPDNPACEHTASLRQAKWQVYDCVWDSECIPYHTDNSTDCEDFLL